MTDPAVPQRLAFERRIQELERKVAELQRTPILTSASITGLLRAKDPFGNTMVGLGNVGSDVDPEYGITVDGPGDFMLAITDERGMMRPWMPGAWRDLNATRTVTTTGFSALWGATVQLLTGLDFKFQVAVVVPAGTGAELQLNTGWGPRPWVLTPVADGALHLYELNGPHGGALLTGPAIFSLEARRTSGAGTVTVYEPYTMAIGHNGDTPGWVTLV